MTVQVYVFLIVNFLYSKSKEEENKELGRWTGNSRTKYYEHHYGYTNEETK